MTIHVLERTVDGEDYEVNIDDSLDLDIIDNGLAFVTSQLAFIEATIYEVKYRNIVFQDFIPVITTDPEWVDEVDYISYNAVTMGKFIGANAKDLPQADISANLSKIRVFEGGISFTYSLSELEKSQQLRIPLDTTKGRAAFRGYQEHMQRVAFRGDTDVNVTGLLNNANVATSTSTIDWDTATGQQRVADCNDLLTDLWTNSAEVHLAGVLLLPSPRYAQLSNNRMDTGTDTTELAYLIANNIYTQMTGQPLTVRPLRELQTASASNGERMMAYELNDENLTMRAPMPFQTLPPQAKGLSFEVPSRYKFGGVEFRFPGAAAYREFA